MLDIARWASNMTNRWTTSVGFHLSAPVSRPIFSKSLHKLHQCTSTRRPRSSRTQSSRQRIDCQQDANFVDPVTGIVYKPAPIDETSPEYRNRKEDFDVDATDFRPDIPHLNTAILIGRVGQDPVFRNVGRDDTRKKALLTFSLAVRDQLPFEFDTPPEPTTSWFRCEVWGPQAELGQRLLQKGIRISVTGTLGLSTYVNRAGEEVDDPVIVVRRFDILQSKSEATYRPSASQTNWSNDGPGQYSYSSSSKGRNFVRGYDTPGEGGDGESDGGGMPPPNRLRREQNESNNDLDSLPF